MSLFADLSQSSSALAAEIAPRIIAVGAAGGRTTSGFIWSTGLAVAAAEVLDGDDDIDVFLDGGKTPKATIAGRDPSTDVALLRFDTGPFADWTAAATPKPASLALVAGRGEDSLIASPTAVTEVGPAWRSMRGGQIDAYVGLGLRLSARVEGAAAVAPDGALLGMAVSSARRRTIVIPASTIARSVAALAEKGYVPRGWLGVMLHQVEGPGAIILSVEAGSPAAKAGLLVGDVITTWNGEAIASVGNLASRLSASSVGTRVKLGVVRGGNAVDVEAVLDERPRR